MKRALLSTWISLSAIIVGGFFVMMYLLMFRSLVVGSDQEWKFIDMMFGALVTVFGQLIHSWMSWFVGPAEAREAAK